MQPEGASAIARHLEEKVIAYWHDVDFNWGRNAADHYTVDGVFVSPHARYEGREQIREFYAWRAERGARVNVHLVGNFHLRSLGENEAEVHWICTLYAHDGAAPQQSAPPVAISRVEDSFVRDGDGPWLCRQRRWHTLFRSDIPTTRLNKEEMATRMGKTS
ncbi:nuclear transport factor 2 family protein [Chelativorans sp. AA-79]|uniref:nuclear transport factor 2 family protein n=1 Tax=Chelativorans sp. AA-79 TaxID=3028735 RepID=UPI0023F87465|nr:nuclear transport factor 2 family protein [Chelativorans sp. AA-79]WEX08102.1 nuclear transport factor 2 family protein [Chelativorans sp. AA-79]